MDAICLVGIAGHHDFVWDFLFADDCALNADSKDAMQRSMDKLSAACDAFGLTISIKKPHPRVIPGYATDSKLWSYRKSRDHLIIQLKIMEKHFF